MCENTVSGSQAYAQWGGHMAKPGWEALSPWRCSYHPLGKRRAWVAHRDAEQEPDGHASQDTNSIGGMKTQVPDVSSLSPNQ